MKNSVIQCLLVGNLPARYPFIKDMLSGAAERGILLKISETVLESPVLQANLGSIDGANLILADAADFNLPNGTSAVSHRFDSAPPEKKDGNKPSPDHSQNTETTIKPGLQSLIDRIWQWVPDAVFVLVQDDSNPAIVTDNLHIPDDIVFTPLTLTRSSGVTRSEFRILLQTARLKHEFRQCKRLLGVSEKRSQWLLDSSREAVAYVSRDVHLYANQVYLDLFGIHSQAALRSLPLHELVVDDEQQIFRNYLKFRLKENVSMPLHTLSLKRRDGLIMRCKVRAIPAVFQGKRCLQLWVYAYQTEADVKSGKTATQKTPDKSGVMPNESPVSGANMSHRVFDQAKSASKAEDVQSIWFGELPQEKAKKVIPETLLKQSVDTGTLLKEILRRNEARLFSVALAKNNPQAQAKQTDSGYFLIGLKVPFIQRKAVDDLLEKAYGAELNLARPLFWDKVKLVRLFEWLENKRPSDIRLVIRLTQASVREKRQRLWLESRLKKMPAKSRMLLFLFPDVSIETDYRLQLEFARILQGYGCLTGLDEFRINNASIYLVNQIKPDLIRFSNQWLRAIEGIEAREYALSQLIRELEKRNIRVIVPCGFSVSMNKLFLLSGASFCQKRRSPSA